MSVSEETLESLAASATLKTSFSNHRARRKHGAFGYDEHAVPDDDRVWLTELVAPIILPEEERVFLKLTEGREREGGH